MKKAVESKAAENPLYHDTWMLLRKYRDVVWGLELSVQQVRRQFQTEFGSSIEDFLESIYLAGVISSIPVSRSTPGASNAAIRCSG